MEQLASDTCTNRRVTCILNRVGFRRGCVGGVSVGVSVRKSGGISQ